MDGHCVYYTWVVLLLLLTLRGYGVGGCTWNKVYDVACRPGECFFLSWEF